MLIATLSANADGTFRVATFNAELKRKGPGLLFRDLLKGEDPHIDAVLSVLREADADIVALQSFDYDLNGRALALFAERAGYPFSFAQKPNTGQPTGLDLDLDDRLGGPADAQGFGYFSGQGGMAILSRFEILEAEVQDFSDLLWRDLPGALRPTAHDGAPYPSQAAFETQRLSTTGHWIVPIVLPDGQRIDLMTFHATPPVFDGPEDHNGKRNHDEIRFWQLYLDGSFGSGVSGRFVLAGDANLDPSHSDGRREAIRNLLADPRLRDVQPVGAHGTDSVDWTDVDAGILRVDYVLPSSDWIVEGSGVLWPDDGDPFLETVKQASRHRVVWVDLRLP
ncbi:MAG: endonuclease/exonuclease/phosphatase family protein [Pseudomonadota bacterium]